MKTRPNRMKPIGLLGGGQLARMLALKAHDMGVPVAVYSESSDDPAAQVVALHTRGRLGDAAGLKKFLKSCSIATFESEFLDAKLLTRLSAERGSAKIFPQPRLMGLLQDRLTQKKRLLKAGLPTSEFVELRELSDAHAAFLFFDRAVVFKKRRFGYDGYGTWVVRSEKELAKFIQSLRADLSSESPVGFIAERFVPFRRETALLVARSQNGDVVRFPFVETHQENSRCLWVKGPIKESAGAKALAKKAAKFLRAEKYVGLMAFELFETARGELLVNELAPRVHNSGHYSLDALSSDQFTMHLKCILGLPLEAPRVHGGGFAMMNLLGRSSLEPSWTEPPEARLHWYGKRENRPGRKMGHYNVTAPTPERALRTALALRSKFNV